MALYFMHFFKALIKSYFKKLRGRDSNPRPSGYGPDELPAALPRVDVKIITLNLF